MQWKNDRFLRRNICVAILLSSSVSTMALGASAKCGNISLAHALKDALVEKDGGVGSLVRLSALKQASDPEFCEANLSVDWESPSRKVAISKDGRVFVDGELFRLKGIDADGVRQALSHAWSLNSQDAIKIEMAGDPNVNGFKTYKVDVTQGQHKQSLWINVTADRRYATTESIYAIRMPAEIEKILSSDDSPSIGSKMAAITIVAFTDFQCLACAQVDQELIEGVLAEHQSDIRLVFKDFPLDYHPVARIAAVAGQCVFKTSPLHYSAYRRSVFVHQSDLSSKDGKSELLRLASEAGADQNAVQQCTDEPFAGRKIDSDIDEGKLLQIARTPTIYINGHGLSGALSMQDLEQSLQVARENVAKESQNGLKTGRGEGTQKERNRHK